MPCDSVMDKFCISFSIVKCLKGFMKYVSCLFIDTYEAIFQKMKRELKTIYCLY